MKGYHGTSHYGEIKKFKKSKSGALGSGLIYFAADEKLAKSYATKDYGEGDVYEVELTVNKPLVIPRDAEPVDFVLSQTMARRRKNANGNYCYWLKASDYTKYRNQGYDCIIYRDEIAVFDPEVIKITNKKHITK